MDLLRLKNTMGLVLGKRSTGSSASRQCSVILILFVHRFINIDKKRQNFDWGHSIVRMTCFLPLKLYHCFPTHVILKIRLPFLRKDSVINDWDTPRDKTKLNLYNFFFLILDFKNKKCYTKMCTCNWISYPVNNTLIYSYYDIIILLIKGNISQILFFVPIFAISSLSFKLLTYKH